MSRRSRVAGALAHILPFVAESGRVYTRFERDCLSRGIYSTRAALAWAAGSLPGCDASHDHFVCRIDGTEVNRVRLFTPVGSLCINV